MPRPRIDTLDSYEDVPLDSPERRMIQNRNAQRVYRLKAKKSSRKLSTKPTAKVAPNPLSRGGVHSTVVPTEATSDSAGVNPSIPVSMQQGLQHFDRGTATALPRQYSKNFDVGMGDSWGIPPLDGGQAFRLNQTPSRNPQEFESLSLSAQEANFVEQYMSVPLDNSMPSVPAVPGSDVTANLDHSHSDQALEPQTSSQQSQARKFNMSHGGNLPQLGPHRTQPVERPSLLDQYSRSTTSIELLPGRTSSTPSKPWTQTRRSPFLTPEEDSAPDVTSSEEEEDHGVWRHPIHTAAHSGRIQVIQLLLQSGINPSERDGAGSTPLHIAAAKGHHEIVKLLLESGSNINAVDGCGWSPVHLATKNGHENCVRLFLHQGADLWSRLEINRHENSAP